jgi:hypothetical protein
MPDTIAKMALWLVWSILLSGSITTHVVLGEYVLKDSSWAPPIGLVNLAPTIAVIVLCLALRFWCIHIRGHWIRLIPYIIGLATAHAVGLCGIFVQPSLYIVCSGISAALFLAYLPPYLMRAVRSATRPGHNDSQMA